MVYRGSNDALWQIISLSLLHSHDNWLLSVGVLDIRISLEISVPLVTSSVTRFIRWTNLIVVLQNTCNI